VTATSGNQSSTVSFAAPLANGGSSITSYTVTATDTTNAANGGQTATGSTSPLTVAGLTNGDTYTFTVHATNGAGSGPESSASAPTVPATVPAAPTAVAATPGNGSASISFMPPSSDGGATITSYTVTATDTTTVGNGGQTASGGSSPITVSGLTDGDSYTFTVHAVNAAGNSADSAPSAPAVPKAPSATALTSSANPSTAGQPVTFTATVTTGTGTATGTVTFTDGKATLGSATLNASGVATLTTSTLSAATHTISATYNGALNLTPSSGSIAQVITNTTTSLTSSANPAVAGQRITFTVTVAPVPPASGSPQGSVTFRDGATVLGTLTLNTKGSAALAVSNLTVGTHSVTATYSGAGSLLTSASPALGQVVNKAATSTSLSSSNKSSVFSQPVTFTATVTPVAPGSGTPAGTISLNDGATTLATATLNANGVATFTTASLTVATHTITANYLGASTYAPSASTALTQTVNQAKTSMTLASSGSPTTAGQPLTITATVSPLAPGTAAPVGTVTFKDGTNTLATATLDPTGVATVSTSALSVGTHTITAGYSGSANFATSASSLSQVITNTTTTLTSSANPAVTGQTVTFTAVVAAVAPAKGTPTGNIIFKDGTAVLATVSLDATGSATFTTVKLTNGSHNITAAYSGGGSFIQSNASVAQFVTNSTTFVSATPNPSTAGQTVTFTATVRPVAPATGTPTGTVTFTDGTTVLGVVGLDTNGTAVMSSSTISPGAHTIIATYSGNATLFSSNAQTPHLVQ
jgi:hypothetical protein